MKPTTTPLASVTCHPWDRKLPALAVVAALVFFAAVAAHAGSCCKKPEPVAEKPAACCPTDKSADAAAANPHEHRELPPAGFTRDSLYQLDATFTTDAEAPFALAQLRGRPVLVAMFFASCNYACPLLVADITRVREALPSPLREEVALVLVSFDVVRDTPAALKKYREDRLLGPQWTLLHGDESAVAELAALLGVKFKQEANGQYAHSNLITVLNREGEIVHQRAGLQGGLTETAAALTRLP
jgi:protein SCO1/2